MLIVYRHCLILKFLFRFQFFCSCTSQSILDPRDTRLWLRQTSVMRKREELWGRECSQSRQESHCSWPEPLFRGAGQKERGSGDENAGAHPLTKKPEDSGYEIGYRKTGSCMRARPKGHRTRESQINKHGRKSFTRDRYKPYVRRYPMLICWKCG